MRNYSFFLLGVTFLTILGCSKPPITVYRIPHEAPIALPGEAMPAPSGQLDWTLPSGWASQPATPPRLATFAISGGKGCEVTITQFPGDAGGLLANVNRWRGQLGLNPIEESQLESSVQHKQPGQFLFTDVSLVDSAGAKALRVALFSFSNATYFIKLTGNPADVSRAGASFDVFLKGLHPHASH